ncbi:hypothetical protein GBQ70_11690 [Halomicrobium sp. ZPS1]|uniref:Uncharacterized protein n=2 Tax=Halomicrobium mukohataei TaxID=57705 RepID=C7NYE7_HALMD|nr:MULTISPECIES: hypothetical protein [Halomicrobium]ACV46608.1 conserved hypothetical protein [Halomicrobium mukohataei DSM 12286]ACV47827.1 conserved hypothetical protein [Halomicrobium mukohataei DSM 12286]QCD66274.1 hypothetical protein E5139_11695 [Halomicrobium mukohataei]QFR21080.1 hypothetical protein GBQ70_11690 [Halomicrobium sp. ZPS1]
MSPAPAAAAAGGALADNADEVADVAKQGSADARQVAESRGGQILMVVIGLGLLYYVYTAVTVGSDVADGAQDAADDVGGAAGDSWDGATDVADGTGDVVSDGMDWWLGGAADTVEGAGDAAGNGFSWATGGAADTVEDAGDAIGGLL